MTRQCDGAKQLVWAERFARLRASWIGVERFRVTEGVSANTFYYWIMRVSSAERVDPRSSHAEAKMACGWGADSRNGAATAAPTSFSTEVRFQFAADVTVWVPAEYMEVIRCLTDFARRAAASERAPLGAARARSYPMQPLAWASSLGAVKIYLY